METGIIGGMRRAFPHLLAYFGFQCSPTDSRLVIDPRELETEPAGRRLVVFGSRGVCVESTPVNDWAPCFGT